MKRMLGVVLCLLGLSVPLASAEQASPADRFPSAVGLGFSDLAGSGLTYRFFDTTQGWQISGAVATVNPFYYSNEHYFTVGCARNSVLYSFVPNQQIFSQFSWLAGGSWRSRTFNPSYPGPTRWSHVLTAGPGLGLELGFLEHFVLDLGVNYQIAYDFGTVPEGLNRLSFSPGVSWALLVRY